MRQRALRSLHMEDKEKSYKARMTEDRKAGDARTAANGNGQRTKELFGGNGNASERAGVPSSVGQKGAPYGQILRRVFVGFLAACALLVCRWLAYQFRFDFDVPKQYQVQLSRHWLWIVSLQLTWLLLFRQFSGIFKYFSLPEIRHLAYAMTFSGISLYAMRFLDAGFAPPRGVILVQCMSGFLALAGMRAAWRVLHERYFSRRNRHCSNERRVVIIGAGDVGASLVRELYARPNLGLLPVVFLDDDRKKWSSWIHGIRVAGAPEELPRLKAQLELQEVVIAMPSAPPKRLSEIIGVLQKARLKYVTVPSIDQLTSGSVRV